MLIKIFRKKCLILRQLISTQHLSIGSIKDKVLMSHMTPNRKLEMY